MNQVDEITNRQQLIEKLMEVWHHDPGIVEIAKKCIRNMTGRNKDVIKTGGGVTKY